MLNHLRTRLTAALAIVAAAAVLGAPATPCEAAGLLVADGGFGGVLKVKDHDVRVTINNGVAVTEVEQLFVNTENRIVEALYTFPVPKGASVANFSMWINGKEMIGEVVEKQRAREIYNSYKQTRRDPGLLEQVDYKTFEMRIFPIAARAEQRVKIAYYQELDFDNDYATYVYPLATNAQRKTDQTTTGRFSLSFDVKSEVPVTALKSPSHADDFAIVKHDSDRYWQASLEASGGNLDRDVVIGFQVARPRTGIDIVTSRTGGEDGYFLLTLTAGKELEEANIGADYVFLLDVSGSMARDGKLGLSRGSLAAFVDSLGEKDRFELITFNVASNTLFGTLSKVDDESKKKAHEFLDSQRAQGGTVLRPAMDAAYRYRNADRPLNVVVLSDGMTEQREQRELLDLIANRPSGASVFCVGVGNDVNRPLLTQLANQAGGLAAFISTGDDFNRQAEAFRRKLTRPAATNVKIDLAGADVYDVEPRQLPNLYHGQPLRVYGRYRKAGPSNVNVAADILGSPLKQTIEVSLPATDEANPQIERMWAWHRVERLMEESRSVGSPGLTQDEIVRLCEGYSITSEYASFIVLENDAEYGRWKIDRRNATRIVRDRRSQEAVRDKLNELRRQTEQAVGPAKGEQTPKQANATPTQPTIDTSVPADQFAQAPAAEAPRRESRDLNVPRFRSSGGGGGGAIDPFTASAALAMASAALVARRRVPVRTAKSSRGV